MFVTSSNFWPSSQTIGRVISRVAASSLYDAPLRAILQTCYDLYGEGIAPTFGNVSLRLGDRERALAAGFHLVMRVDPGPLEESTFVPPWEARLDSVLTKLAERDRQARLRDLKTALDEARETDDLAGYKALKTEYLRLLTQRPDTKQKTAS